MSTLYIRVTRDKYELPTAVADTIVELAEICGTTKNSISSYISHSKANGRWCRYRRVEIDDDEEELI